MVASACLFLAIAIFRCDAEFGRYRGMADTSIKTHRSSRFMSTRPKSTTHKANGAIVVEARMLRKFS